MATAPLWPLALGLLAFVLGTALFIAGFWPRRRGDSPYCRCCGYSLIGLESSRCPECGTELADHTIVRGERIRRPWVFRPGILLAMTGIFLLSIHFTGALTRVDWYQHRPATWLVRDLADANRQARAMAELDRRRQAGRLGEKIEDQITVLALKEQVSPNPAPLVQNLLDFVAARIEAGKLSDTLKDQFFEQAMGVALQIRPTVVAGDPVPFRVSRNGRGPSGDWWVRMECRGATLNGAETNSFRGSTSGSSFGGGSIGSSMQTKSPGPHTIEATIAASVHKGRSSAGKLLWSRNKTLAGSFNVLPQASSGHVKLLDQPELLAEMQAAVRATQVERRSNGEYAIVLDLRNAPANAAFEVFARIDGREYPIGTMALSKGKQMGFGLSADSIKGINAEQMDFILRSSEKVARGTVELYEIWKGEITLQGVKVH